VFRQKKHVTDMNMTGDGSLDKSGCPNSNILVDLENPMTQR